LVIGQYTEEKNSINFCKLQESLYGLKFKTSSNLLELTIQLYFKYICFTYSEADACVFKTHDGQFILSTYFDADLITAANEEIIK